MQNNGHIHEESFSDFEEIENRVSIIEFDNDRIYFTLNTLKVKSRHWRMAMLFCIITAIYLIILAAVFFGLLESTSSKIDAGSIDIYTAQTIIMTLLVAVTCAGVFCFIRFTTLRSLVDEAYYVNKTNSQALWEYKQKSEWSHRNEGVVP